MIIQASSGSFSDTVFDEVVISWKASYLRKKRQPQYCLFDMFTVADPLKVTSGAMSLQKQMTGYW